jgi:MucR family transcriptional regulator, transcriptional regulator of exopolysaccharide biosynthesis
MRSATRDMRSESRRSVLTAQATRHDARHSAIRPVLNSPPAIQVRERNVEIKEHVAEIVSAYLRKNYVSADQLTSTIATVYDTLARLGKPDDPAVPLTPAVPVRRSVRSDHITCLECGWSGKTIRRHLTSAHGLTPGEYRARWSLERDYPMVAPNYAAQRSEFAKSIGLGARGRGRRGDAPSQQDSTAVQGD